MMDTPVKDFESFEQQLKELISEFQTLSTSESHLRNTLRSESARAEAADAAKDSALRVLAESQAAAAAATAGATQATKALAAAQDEVVTVKMQLELSDRERALFEENYSEMSNKLNAAERELQQLRPLQAAQTTLQQQYIELHRQIRSASEAAKKEASRLEQEFRLVERGACAGAAVRERARLAAAAHARERRHYTAELRHTSGELRAANAEVTRLATVVDELRRRLSAHEGRTTEKSDDTEVVLGDLKAALETERVGAARLEKTLASALAANAALAAELNSNDNNLQARNPSHLIIHDGSPFAEICPIDSFLAD